MTFKSLFDLSAMQHTFLYDDDDVVVVVVVCLFCL